jgi:PAS domain S-box-containing protein
MNQGNKMEPVSWRILMVDDDDDDYLIAKMLLDQARDRNIILDWAPTYESGKASLLTDHYDAVLVDYDLGARTGIEFIREAVAGEYHAPFILFTGRGSYEVDLEAMQAGASLYLTKAEANQLLLERGIRYAIERKAAEQALRASEENYRQLFTAMLDGFALHEIICDPNGAPVDYRFIEVNAAFEQLTGLKAADILGKTVLEVLPETEDYWIHTYGEVALTGKAIRFENYSRGLDRHYEVVAFSPCQGQFAVVFTDITRRKLAEKALLAVQEELEQRVQERTQELSAANNILERILSSVDLMVAYLDRSFNFVRVNENYARAAGQEPAFFIGKNHFDLYPHAENEAVFRRVVETGEPYHTVARPFEYPDKPERGITYWDWSLQPVKGEDGRVSALLLTLLDVTERHRAVMEQHKCAQRAQASAEMLEGLFRSAPDATLLVDERGKIIRVNRQAEYMFGYAAEELDGASLEILLPERLRPLHAAQRSMYLNSPTLQPMGSRESYTCRRKDGEEFPVDVMLSPFQIEDRLHVICVVREV